MTLLDPPEKLRCLWRLLRLVSLTEFHPRNTNEQTNLLSNALNGCTCKSTIKLKNADEKNLQLHFDSKTKLARTDSAWGTESGALNR